MDPEARLARLEARIAAIEEQLRIDSSVAAAAEAPRAPQAPWPEAAKPPARPPGVPMQPTRRAEVRDGRDLERFIGLAVLGRIGVAAIVLAAAWFAQLGWGRLGPIGRVTAIYLLAAVMVGIGQALRHRVRQHYVALFYGGAVALSYLAGVVAKLRYDLVDSPTALVMLVASAALGQFLALRIRMQVMALVALAGAYAAPTLVGTPSPSPTLFFVYLLALHAWAACAEQWWQWIAARRLAVAATTSLVIAWFANASAMPPALSVVVHAEVVWLCLIAPELLRAFSGLAITHGRWLILLGGSWLAQLALVTSTATVVELPGTALGAGAAIFALGIALRCVDAASAQRGTGMARIGAVLLALGALLVWGTAMEPPAMPWSRPWERIGSLVAMAIALLAARRWSGTSDLALATAIVCAKLTVLTQPTDAARDYAMAALALPALLLFTGRTVAGATYGLFAGCAFTFLAPHGDAWLGGDDAIWVCGAFVATSAWLGIGSFLAMVRNDIWLRRAAGVLLLVLMVRWIDDAWHAPIAMAPFSNLRFAAAAGIVASYECGRRWTPRTSDRFDRTLFAAGLGIAIYLAPLVELLAMVRDWRVGWGAVAVSLYTLLFAGSLLVLGFVHDQKVLRWAGLIGLLGVAVKVPAFDLVGLDTSLRVLLTAALGVVLLLGAFAYARLRQRVPETR